MAGMETMIDWHASDFEQHHHHQHHVLHQPQQAPLALTPLNLSLHTAFLPSTNTGVQYSPYALPTRPVAAAPNRFPPTQSPSIASHHERAPWSGGFTPVAAPAGFGSYPPLQASTPVAPHTASLDVNAFASASTSTYAPLAHAAHPSSEFASASTDPPTSSAAAFFSSYGPYVPISGPYNRFLTPSPGPSVLGAFEEMTALDGSATWMDFELPPPPDAPTDSFLDGLTLGEPADLLDDYASSAAASSARTSANASPLMMGFTPLPSTSTCLPSTSAAEPKKKRKRSATASGDNATRAPRTKKNRNPPATQLPGSKNNGVPEDQLEDSTSSGIPKCTHCSSVTTPLWRRGPNDELLCNACGLYLKLHGTTRPIDFSKRVSTPRGPQAKALAQGETPQCANCSAVSTPMWRKDGEGRLACNACSLYFKLHGVVRPVALSRKAKNRLAAKAAAELEANGEREFSPS